MTNAAAVGSLSEPFPSGSRSLARVTPLSVPCGHSFSCWFRFSIGVPNGMVSYIDAAPNQSPHVLSTVRCRVTRARMTWFDGMIA